MAYRSGGGKNGRNTEINTESEKCEQRVGRIQDNLSLRRDLYTDLYRSSTSTCRSLSEDVSTGQKNSSSFNSEFPNSQRQVNLKEPSESRLSETSQALNLQNTLSTHLTQLFLPDDKSFLYTFQDSTKSSSSKTDKASSRKRRRNSFEKLTREQKREILGMPRVVRLRTNIWSDEFTGPLMTVQDWERNLLLKGVLGETEFKSPDLELTQKSSINDMSLLTTPPLSSDSQMSSSFVSPTLTTPVLTTPVLTTPVLTTPV